MAETQGDVLNKIILAGKQLGLRVTDEKAREAIARDHEEFNTAVFNPSTSAPSVPQKSIDDAVAYLESLM
jgi:hypothetical protein